MRSTPIIQTQSAPTRAGGPNRGAVRGAVAVLGLAALVLSGCGAQDSSGGQQGSSASASSSASSAASDLALPQGWTHVAGTTEGQDVHAEPSLPTEVTDGTGTRVTVRDASKIISAGDGISSTLGALGLKDRIYAAPEDSISPEGKEAKEHFAFNKSTGVEGLLAVDGTLFIGDNTKRHGSVAQKFREAGTDAVVVDDQATQEQKIQAVADYVGAHDAGKKLVDRLTEDFRKAHGSVSEAGLEGTKVIQVTATGAGGQNSVAGTGTPGTEMLEQLGVKSVGAESGLRGFSREFSNEGILAENPDVIIMSESDYSKWGGEEGLWKAFPTLKQTTAGKESRIVVMPDAQLKYSGPQLGAGAQALGEYLTKKA